MKILVIIFTALVGTLILNGPIQAYSDPQLDALLRIASQARDNLSINISQINNTPDEIIQLYKQGINETEALSKAITLNNVTSSRQHFLSAMKFFKTTNDKINSLNATTTNDQQQTDIIRLQSEISGLNNIGERLRIISNANHVNLNFSHFNKLIQQANQDLNADNVDNVSKSIEAANQFVIETHHSLAIIAKQRTNDRAKDFTEKEIERLDKIGNNTNASQNISPKDSNNMTKANSTIIPDQGPPRDLITKLRKLVSEGNVDEALQVIKSLRSYQNGELQTTVSLKESYPQTTANITSVIQGNNFTINIPSNTTKVNSFKIGSNTTKVNSFKIGSNTNMPNQEGNIIKINKTASQNKITESKQLKIDINKLRDKGGKHQINPQNED